MNFWNLFFGGSETEQPEPLSSLDLGINPANGLPMITGTTIDVEGNPYGSDSHDFGVGDFDTGFDWNSQSNFD